MILLTIMALLVKLSNWYK